MIAIVLKPPEHFFLQAVKLQGTDQSEHSIRGVCSGSEGPSAPSASEPKGLKGLIPSQGR